MSAEDNKIINLARLLSELESPSQDSQKVFLFIIAHFLYL